MHYGNDTSPQQGVSHATSKSTDADFDLPVRKRKSMLQKPLDKYPLLHIISHPIGGTQGTGGEMAKLCTCDKDVHPSSK